MNGTWKRIFLGTLFAAAIVVAVPAMAADVRIGALDFEKILKTSKAVRDMRGLFLLHVEREQGKFRELEENLQKEENDFTRRQGRLSDDQRRRERNELDKRRADLKKSQVEINRKLKEEDVQLMQNIRSDIQGIANTLREKEGYLVILDRKSVFALPAASDLTEKVTRIYDAMKNAK